MSDLRVAIETTCKTVARQIHEAFGELSLHFIIHRNGQLEEEIALSDEELSRHPAAPVARNILKKGHDRETSNFLGLAITEHKILMGLTRREYILGLFNINIDQYEDAKQARVDIYHLVWHAIDLLKVRQRPEYRNRFHHGPMIPKRSPMNLSRATLQADTFAATMCGLQGEKNSLKELAKKRALESLTPLSDQRAEDYPFVMSIEAAQYAFSEITKNTIPKNVMVTTALELAEDVGETFDESNIQQWWNYSEPAQDMAWRGQKKEEILGAAVNTSEDPFVRATAYLVMEVTELNPLSASEMSNSYNAFTNPEKNERLHRDMTDTFFEEIILMGVEEQSSDPFINAANHQNENLTQGFILGWCAHALQAAAKAFESALASGNSPAQAAKLEFETTKAHTSWDAIRELGEKIVTERREGFTVTLQNIADLCKESSALDNVLKSLTMTMSHPSYLQKYEYANDLNVIPSMDVAPMPAAKPSAPAIQPSYAPSPAPGLGLGGAPPIVRPPSKIQNTEKRDEQ